MKSIWAIAFSLCLMLPASYAQDVPVLPVLPTLEVTALATCEDRTKVRAIINDRIVKKGDLFEVTADGKLGVRIVITKKPKKKKKKKGAKFPPVKIADRLLEIGEITKRGVTIHYSEPKTNYIESKTVPLKKRTGAYGLTR